MSERLDKVTDTVRRHKKRVGTAALALLIPVGAFGAKQGMDWKIEHDVAENVQAMEKAWDGNYSVVGYVQSGEVPVSEGEVPGVAKVRDPLYLGYGRFGYVDGAGKIDVFRAEVTGVPEKMSLRIVSRKYDVPKVQGGEFVQQACEVRATPFDVVEQNLAQGQLMVDTQSDRRVAAAIR
jgi:hypothetical protein